MFFNTLCVLLFSSLFLCGLCLFMLVGEAVVNKISNKRNKKVVVKLQTREYLGEYKSLFRDAA